MDFDMIVDILFKSEYGVKSFHDSIHQACEISHNDEQLKELFLELPLSIQRTAMDGGLSDTVFGDEVYMHVKKEGEKYGTDENNSD